MKKLSIFFLFLFCFSSVFSQQKPEGLFINSKAPDFKAKDPNGIDISLKELRKKGSTVLLFYRGNWCPYCNKQLKKFQDSLQYITAKGAQLIAITPEAKEGIDATITKTGVNFPILFDQGMKISESYAVAFGVDERTVGRYKNSGIDLLKTNLQRAPLLPVPAVYIINKEGSITYRYFDEDYKKRVSVKEILENLK